MMDDTRTTWTMCVRMKCSYQSIEPVSSYVQPIKRIPIREEEKGILKKQRKTVSHKAKDLWAKDQDTHATITRVGCSKLKLTS
jgi:hypothetical protein